MTRSRRLLLLLLLGGCRTAGIPTVVLPAMTAVPPGGAALGELAFMTGCWRSAARGAARVTEERWTPPAGQLMLGTTRNLEGGLATGFEFATIAAEAGVITMTPYPGGVRSPDAFRLTHSGKGSAVFEAPEHDYPKRILYQRVDDGTLLARIDSGEDDLEPRTWRMEAVSCP